ncbi:hypothetical protein [Thiothrix subterranea]|uniref:Uncharacterized protein n=1 Tax=Thiothrix subterranea TaxID=2735563 RepID=A0AA51MM55_9GAMM|nr:hypothetical protein [Thiothrix subterranea]MDQ5767820.1 hypothetical protein [Thiothrix subterranea]QQZ28194.1 hypothetical protein HMY34_05170 [Thiothrix subterranea]WML86718.1 hypothetical protein RCG00_20850 [Thiothrix subterranea]
MLQWLINSVTDVLIAFALATLFLFVGAVNYPEFFPQRFFHYWVVATPEVAPKQSVEAAQQVSVVTQVQR